MKKLISLSLVFSMLLTLMVPGIGFAANDKAAISDKMSPIYSELTETEKTTMKAAFDAAKAFDSTSIPNMTTTMSFWDITEIYAAADKLKTGKVDDAYLAPTGVGAAEYVERQALIQFVKALAMIKHAYSDASLQEAMDYFEKISTQGEGSVAAQYSVMNVLFSSITSADLIELFLNTYSHIGNYVTATDAEALSTAATAEAFIAASKPVVKKAYAGEATALGLDTLLYGYEWDGDLIVILDDEIRTTLGATGSKADIALVNAMIRSEATISGTQALTEGNTVSYAITLFGQTTNYIKLTSSNTAIATVSGNINVTAVDAGTATIYVHRSGTTTPVAGEDYLYSFAVVVSEPSSGGGSGGSSNPPADDDNDTSGDAVNDDADSAVEDSNNVASEADAEKVAEKVTETATALQTTIKNATTTEEKEQVATAVTNLTTAILNSSKVVASEAAAKTVLTSTKTLLESTQAAAASVSTATQSKALTDSTKNLLRNAATVISKVTDAAEAKTIATDLIKAAASVATASKTSTVVNTGEAKKAANEIQTQIEKVAKAAIAVAGTQTIAKESVTVAAGVGSVAISASELASKAQAAASAKADMESIIRATGVQMSKNVKPQVTINVPVVEGADVIEANMSGLSDVFAVVDEVKVVTPTASFEIDKNSFSEDLTTDVKVSAKNVSVTDLSAVQRAQVPSNAKVIDLNASVGDTKVSTFKKPINVALPYELSANENPDKLTVFLLKDDGTIESVPAKYENGQVTFSRKGFSIYFVKENDVNFTDLTSVEWARDAIEYIAAKGITGGTSATTFSPNAQITRAEFLTMLMKIAQLNGDASALPFTDVQASDWYAESVAAAFENDITSGTSTTTFSPDAPITRQDMAVMVAKVMLADGYLPGVPADAAEFNDLSQIKNYAVQSVALASREGIMNGTDLGNFNPTANATRAEAAAMLYNLFTK
ncbi:S-layer homology domain-containing protein [Fusibacter paucivorans]|uniref:S-layer homology domain-containing protein n=1 Tax=Fusibacter paucivorans TaxID=76009 RepID=A0ABS5PNA7_9FIRM|nr:S-layer homology domain-containing protein [Fusibacter paucivorans]MBS7525874.1 S-layer homology domain-containing protein [Fusibacter paucivorans]